MQSLSPSISRGKPPFQSARQMPRGGGLPLCLSGVCIMTQVPHGRRLRSSSSRNRRPSQVSSASRDANFRTSLAESFGVNPLRVPSADACDGEDRTRDASTAVPSDRNGDETTDQPPRYAIAQEMAELDRRRDTIKERRSVQGLGSFLEEQFFFVSRQARRPLEIIRSGLQELSSLEPDFNNLLLNNFCAKAA